MPRRKTTDAVAGRYDGVHDEKNQNRLRKLMATLGVPADATEVRFFLDGDELRVAWFMQPESTR
jgi:hypothetical protein